MKLALSLTILLLFCLTAYGEDSTYIKVHFLYGSKPKKEFKATQSRWFGGILGGHVGIEVDSNKIIDFVPEGKFHVIAHRRERHSRFAVHSTSGFWELFGSDADSVKRTTIIIPVSGKQKQKLDSIFDAYTAETPYDYAFMGMRCGAAAYDILAQLGIVDAKGRRVTYFSIFYPKKLRKRLLRKATTNHWTVIRSEGCTSRKWERD